MSLDYRNREDWLAVRRQPKNPAPGHFIHLAGFGKKARRSLPENHPAAGLAGITYIVRAEAKARRDVAERRSAA